MINIFRWYRSSWGKYTQRDPVGLIAGNNLYSYVLNNPIQFIDMLGLVRVHCRCDEDFAGAIENARHRMDLAEHSGTAVDPSGSNEVTAQTICERFTIVNPTTGQRRTIGSPRTERHDQFEDGPCLFLCVSMHEAYHRRQCEHFSQLNVTLTEAQWEWPAYREEIRCLQAAQRQRYLDIRSNPPGQVDY